MPRKSTTPSFSEKDIPDLKGYVIIVTGGKQTPQPFDLSSSQNLTRLT